MYFSDLLFVKIYIFMKVLLSSYVKDMWTNILALHGNQRNQKEKFFIFFLHGNDPSFLLYMLLPC